MLSIAAGMDNEAVQMFHTQDALFAENAGQWDNADRTCEEVYFGYNKGGTQIYFTDDGLEFGLSRRELKEGVEVSDIDQMMPGEQEDAYDYMSTHFSLSFDSATPTVPTGADQAVTRFNYHLGEQENWVDGVSTYKTVLYDDLYAGIDLHTFSQHGQMKYEFHVSPGSDYSQIKLSYTGIDGLTIGPDGSLHIATELGGIVDEDLYIYQTIDGQQVEIDGQFTLIDVDTYTFTITGEYDPTVELIIDPNLDWGSYLGGSSSDEAYDVSTDEAGNIYLAGETTSDYWISNEWDLYRSSGDGFVVKLSSTGTHLYSSYIGGSGNDEAYGVSTDAAGNVYVAGITGSSSWVSDGWDVSYGGELDGFLLKLDCNGGYLWSSYIGGSDWDEVEDVSTDATGNVYVAGYTQSDGWVSDGWDTSHGGGSDGFLVKLSSTGNHLWSSYLGGSDWDKAYGVSTDASGNVYVAGFTQSGGWVSDGWDTSYGGGGDGFLVKLSSTGSHLWSSYLGGGGEDSAYDVSTDASRNVYVVGYTGSSGWVSGGWDVYPYSRDGFLVKLAPNGNHLWSSYIGGSGYDYANGVSTDAAGNVYVAGTTPSSGWVSGGWDVSHGGGFDGFLVKFNSNGDHIWSSYLGGSDPDFAQGVDTDAAGSVYVVGRTMSYGWVSGGWDVFHSGGADGFILKVDDTTVITLDAPMMFAEPATTTGTSNTITWSTVTGAGAYYVEYDTSTAFYSPDGNSGWSTGTSHTFTGLTEGQTYYYRVKARQSGGTVESDWSNVVFSQQIAPAPDAPVMVAEPATTTGTSNTVSWSAVTGAGTYYVEYDTSTAFSSPDGNSGWISGTFNTFTGLTEGQTYYYRAKARQSGGTVESDWSNVVFSTQESNMDFGDAPDSAASASTLLTTMAAGNGADGTMFDITAINTVTITSFDGHPQANADWEIYYRVGSYMGYENSSSAWTLVGSATGVVAQAQGTPTPIPISVDVTIPAGETYAFYVTTTGANVYYTNGSSVGNVYASDANIQFHEGIGNTYPFGDTFSPRIFNGQIHYETETASLYPTLLANDGARHADTGPTLGLYRDDETDGQPSTGATGDDLNGTPDDEDGVTFLDSTLWASVASDNTAASVQVNLQNADTSSNYLDAWIDFNHDGDWTDAGEKIFSNYDLGTSDGTQTLTFTIPQDTGGNIELGDTYARFRLSTTGNLLPTGPASDGEVEDCIVSISLATPVLDPEPTTTLGTSNTVTWSAVADEYYVEYDTSNTFDSPDDNSGWITDTSYEFTSLAEGQTYYYRVKARQTGGIVQSDWSNVVFSTQNSAPILAAIGDQTIDELDTLTFTATATDTDALTYSLTGTVPTGASIDSSSGEFTWAPTEGQGPGSYTFTVNVSDGSFDDFEEITVTVDEVNVAPVLDSISDQTVDELDTLTFTARASDADRPEQELTYSLTGTVPTGASIDSSSGEFTWTPTEDQGPGNYTFTVNVSDGSFDGSEEITVTVDEVNVAPVLDSIGDQTVDELDTLTFTARASDADRPEQELTYSLTGTVPTGASIDSSSGEFTWTPSEDQSPGNYTFTVNVSDGTLSDTEEITVTVNNVPPTAELQSNMSGEVSDFTFSITYSDNIAISTATIDANDILVTGPNDYSQSATLLDVDDETDGTPRTATYRVTSPGSQWLVSDNGTYQISLGTEQVSDTTGGYVPAGLLGTFGIAIAVDDTVSILEDCTVLAIDASTLTANEGENIPIASVASTIDTHGQVQLTDQTITYTPDASFTGVASFEYTIDMRGLQSTATVTVSYPQTITVDSLLDVVAEDGLITLREAIEAANTNTAIGDAPAGQIGLDRIDFDPSLYADGAATVTLCGTELVITSDLVDIQGPGDQLLTIHANEQSTVFGVYSEAVATISGLTVTGGFGGIGNGGTLSLEDMTISGNSISGNGGGIFNVGTLTLTNSTLSGNSASGDGGGIFNQGTLTLTNSTLSGNSATESNGGGIYNRGTLTLTNSTLSANSANGGGGIFNEGGVLTVANSTISSNSVSEAGGGIYNYSYNNGTYMLTITNSTISGNSSNGAGGGIFCIGGYLAAMLNNTVIAENEAFLGPDINFNSGILSGSNNLIGDGSYQSLVHGTYGNIVGTPENLIDPMLGPLQDNGGPTLTHAPLPGSPVIDAGSDLMALDSWGNTLLSDQRGFARKSGTVDIGAVEVQPLGIPVALPDLFQLDQGSSITFQLSDILANDSSSDGSPLTAIILTAPEHGDLVSNPDGTYTYTPESTFWGTDSFSYAAVNGDLESYSTEVFLSVISPDSFLVTTAVDENDDDLSPNDISLREALADPSTSQVQFDASLLGQTIYLRMGTLSASDVQIVGLGSRHINIDGIHRHNVFNVTGNTLISHLAITNGWTSNNGGGIYNEGTLTLANATLSGNSANGDYSVGGGIYNGGILTLTNSTLSGNSAIGLFSFGGGISNGGTLTLTNSSLLGNFADHGGGGIANGHDCTLTLNNTTLSGNSAVYGGGIDNLGTLTVTNSMLSGNSAGIGGGVHNAGTLTIFDSTFLDNSATKDGSLSSPGYGGGGIYNCGYNGDTATLIVSNSTLSGNSASYNGGGIYNYGCDNSTAMLTVTNSTISGNSAAYGGGIANWGYSNGSATMRVNNTTLSGNSSNLGGGVCSRAENGTIALTFTNSIFSGNSAMGGGGIYSYLRGGAATLTVTNSTLVGNIATGNTATGYPSRGGGIANYFSNLILDNTVAARNEASSGPDIFLVGPISGSHNLISDGADQPITNGTDGNIVGTNANPIDPLFIRNPSDGGDGWCDAPETPDFDESTNNDYGNLHLRFDSPALNAGSNDMAVDVEGNPLSIDLDGKQRIIYEIVDIGAYEFRLIADANLDGTVNNADAAVLGANWLKPPSAPGDANLDGFVNEADAVIIAENWLVQSGASWSDGDFNGDGRVDEIDATLLGANWGASVAVLSWADGDFNGDYRVDDIDATLMAANWQQTVSAPATSASVAVEPETVSYDLDNDGRVGLGDLARFAAVYRQQPGVTTDSPDAYAADFDGSGTVDLGDLALFAANYQLAQENDSIAASAAPKIALTVAAAPAIVPGDANLDGMVDDDDATALAANWHKQSAATWSEGDFDGDGKVSDTDVAILARHWMMTAEDPDDDKEDDARRAVFAASGASGDLLGLLDE